MIFLKKTIKSIFIFLMIFGLAFSNLPYDAAMLALQSYVKNRNVVDKIWLTSNDTNVVDKFVPFENVIRNLKIKDALAVSNGDGKIFYSISANATPSTRDYISSTNTFNVAAQTVAGATALQAVTKASPTRDEMIAGYVNSAGTLQVMCWNGATWSNEWSVAVGGTGTTRRFDIAYETNSGDAMVLYSTNVGTTNELAYRTKPGASVCGSANWSAATNLDPVRTTGIVHWVKMAWDRRAAQNLITAIWADANAGLSAMVWSGTAWGNEPTAALETALEIVAAGQDVESFDVEYESLSGDVMIVRGSGGTNGTNGGYYSVCTGGTSTCVWGTRTAMPTILDDVTHLDISADPNSDSILFGAIGNAGSDLSIGVWSGSAWTNTANADISCATPLAGTKFVSTGWLISGANTRGVLVYYDSAATNIGWMTLSGTTWTAQTDWAPTPVFGVQKNYDIKMDPINKDRLIFTVNDANSDIFAKRLILSGTTFTWSNADGGVAIEANTGSAAYKTFDFEYNRYIPAPSASLTIGATAGSKTINLDSGAASQYANTTTCNSAATCSAFTLLLNTGSETITSIKITETGTADATNNLANLALFYDTDGNYSNGVTGQYGTTVAAFTAEAANVSGSLAISAGTTYYFYVRFDLAKTGTYPSGGQTINFQIAANADVGTSGAPTKTGAPATLAGATTISPNATGITYTTGGDGGISGSSATISGYGFGTPAAGAAREDCAAATVNYGCVKFIVGGTTNVANANISSWGNTQIVFSVATNLVTEGGASAVEVRAANQADATPLTYYVYPNITSLTVPTAVANAAREYSASDSEGIFTANGDHFGSAGSVTILGSTATQQTTAACAGSAYQTTCVGLQAPTAIADNSYTGNIVLTRTSDSKTSTYAGFRILPRIVSLNPSSQSVGSAIEIIGNHLCQNGGVCPSAFDANNKATFYNAVDATALNSWTNGDSLLTGINVNVPTGAQTGNLIIKSNGYDSNAAAFSLLSTIPSDPNVSGNRQYQSDNSTIISIGGYASSSSVILKADISAGLNINMALQVEVQSVGAAFTCGAGNCASAVEGTVVGGGACTLCTSLLNAKITLTGISDGQKHWQARVRNTTTNEYSNWASFGANAESVADFIIDTAAPVITGPSSSNILSNSATISWTTGESSDTRVQYNKTGSFGACSTDCTTITDAVPPGSTNHSVNLSNLDSATTYYYRVRSKDAAGNEAISSVNNFITVSVGNPAKTTKFYIAGVAGSITAASTASSTFSVLAPETSATVQGAFVEISGISNSGGTNNIQVWVNSQATKTYAINASSKTFFRIIYYVSSGNLNLNDSPTINVFYISPQNYNIFITSAKVITTYTYAP